MPSGGHRNSGRRAISCPACRSSFGAYRCRQGHGLPSPVGQRLPFLLHQLGSSYTTNGRHRVTLKYLNYVTATLGTDEVVPSAWLVGGEARIMLQRPFLVSHKKVSKVVTCAYLSFSSTKYWIEHLPFGKHIDGIHQVSEFRNQNFSENGGNVALAAIFWWG